VKRLIIFWCLFYGVTTAGFAQIDVTIPDTKAEKGTSVVIPVNVSDLTNQGVISYQFVVTFDENVLDAVGAISEETLTSSWGFPYVNVNVDGQMTVGGYGIQELSGAGVLVKLQFTVVGEPGEKTDLNLLLFVFNAGDPIADVHGGVFTVSSSNRIGVEKEMKKLRSFYLEQNYPNPFNSRTAIKYKLSERRRVVIKIFDLLGQIVRILEDKSKAPGCYLLYWDGKDDNGNSVPSGAYVYQLMADRVKIVKKKMVLLK